MIRTKKNPRLYGLFAVLAALMLASPLYAVPPVINNLTQDSNTYGSGATFQTYKGIPFDPLQINASNTPTSYTETGVLPAGVTFNTTTGAFSGTPTATTGSFPVTVHAVNGDGTSAATVTVTFAANDTTYNQYTQAYQPTPTPAPTPNGTPYPYPAPNPQGGPVGIGVSIVGGVGGYIPNTTETRQRLNQLLFKGGVLYEHSYLGYDPNSVPGLKADVGSWFYRKTSNWDGIQNTQCEAWHKVGTADTDWQNYND